MDAREALQKARRGKYPYKKKLSDFEYLFAKKPEELLVDSEQHLHLSTMANRLELAKISTAFHGNAGTLTEEVKKNIDLFSANAPLLRVAHQPNLLPYLRMVGQFFLLNTLNKQLNERYSRQFCQVYLIVDYDVYGEKYFRKSWYPDPQRKNGYFSIRYEREDIHRDTLVCHVSKPPWKLVEGWLETIREIIITNQKKLSNYGIHELRSGYNLDNLDRITVDLREAHERALTLSDFCSFFLSRLLNLRWSLPVVFFPLKQTIPLMTDSFQYLFSSKDKIAENIDAAISFLNTLGISISDSLRISSNEFPFWHVCPDCQMRHSFDKIQAPMFLEAQCPNCQRIFGYSIEHHNQPDLSKVIKNSIPKVLYDDLNDCFGWGACAGIGYSGSTEHVLLSTLLSSTLGWPKLPEILWEPKGIHYGLGEISQNQNSDKFKKSLELSLSGRASIIYYLVTQGYEGMQAMWSEHVNDNRIDYYAEGECQFAISSKDAFILEAIRDLIRNQLCARN